MATCDSLVDTNTCNVLKHFEMSGNSCCDVTKLCECLVSSNVLKIPKNTKNTFLVTIKEAWSENHALKTLRRKVSSFKT